MSDMDAFIEKHGLTDEVRRKAALSYMADKVVESVSYLYASMSIGLFPTDKLEAVSSSIEAYLRLLAIDKEMKSNEETEV